MQWKTDQNKTFESRNCVCSLMTRYTSCRKLQSFIYWIRLEPPAIPPVSTVPLEWWSSSKLMRKGAGCRALCTTLCSTSQHSTTWWWDLKLVRKELGFRTQHRTLSPPINMVPHGGEVEGLWRKMGFRAQHGTLCSTSQHSTTWWSDWQLVKKEVGFRA